MEKKIVVKGTKSQILGVFYRTLASMSSNPSDRKFLNKEGKIIERTRQEGKVYVGTITCI